jgi:hypothetical protein
MARSKEAREYLSTALDSEQTKTIGELYGSLRLFGRHVYDQARNGLVGAGNIGSSGSEMGNFKKLALKSLGEIRRRSELPRGIHSWKQCG